MQTLAAEQTNQQIAALRAAQDATDTKLAETTDQLQQALADAQVSREHHRNLCGTHEQESNCLFDTLNLLMRNHIQRHVATWATPC